MNAATVQKMTRTTRPRARRPTVCATEGRAGRRASGSARRSRADAGRRARVDVGEIALEEHRPAGVADRRDQDRSRTDELRATTGDVDADQRDDAGEADEEPRKRRRSTRSLGSKRSARSAIMSGTAATMIAASDEATWRSPAAISGNGKTISAPRMRAASASACARSPSVPAAPGHAATITAPREIRAHARNSGGMPPSTATRMNRYGIPHSTDTAANAAHARAFTDRLSQVAAWRAASHANRFATPRSRAAIVQRPTPTQGDADEQRGPEGLARRDADRRCPAKIEQLEAKLADLRVLERIYSERHETAAEPPRARPTSPRARRPARQNPTGRSPPARRGSRPMSVC